MAWAHDLSPAYLSWLAHARVRFARGTRSEGIGPGLGSIRKAHRSHLRRREGRRVRRSGDDGGSLFTIGLPAEVGPGKRGWRCGEHGPLVSVPPERHPGTGKIPRTY